VVFVRGGAEVARLPVGGWGHVDLAIVDALGQLQVAAHRLGCAIRLDDVSAELAGLLDFVGLRVEVGRQPEQREE
jgi:hypothetical protein